MSNYRSNYTRDYSEEQLLNAVSGWVGTHRRGKHPVEIETLHTHTIDFVADGEELTLHMANVQNYLENKA